MTVTKKALITGQDGRHHSTTANLTRILAEVRLDEVDTLRAQSRLAVSVEAPEDTADVDHMAATCLDATGAEVTIRTLAETIARVTGYQGQLRFDPSKPDGPPRKLLDVSRLSALGWQAQIGLEQGLRQTYDWFLSHQNDIRL
jgi:GDP-L-fucose synthase